MTSVPSVSIVTPCYKAERFLGHTIESVLAQTFTDWEYIIVIDGSPDASIEVARRYASEDVRITVIDQANRGVCAARRYGYSRCSADSRYVIWLDQDDCLAPTMIQELVMYLDVHPDVGLVFCNRHHIDENGQEIFHNWKPERLAPSRFGVRLMTDSEPETPFRTLFVQDALTSPSCSLFRRSAYDLTDGWNTRFGQIGEDWDLTFFMALVARVDYLPRKLVYYRIHSRQISSSKDNGTRQYKKLYNKWSKYEGVPRDKIQIVSDAIRFRERRVLPRRWLKYGNASLNRGNVRAAVHCYAVASKCLGVSLMRRLAVARHD